MITKALIMKDVPNKEALQMADSLLYAVYKWNPNKISKMSLASIEKWVLYAKKRMTYRDAYLLNKMLEPSEKKGWLKKILSKIKS